jgi:hypothetical protein
VFGLADIAFAVPLAIRACFADPLAATAIVGEASGPGHLCMKLPLPPLAEPGGLISQQFIAVFVGTDWQQEAHQDHPSALAQTPTTLSILTST